MPRSTCTATRRTPLLVVLTMIRSIPVPCGKQSGVKPGLSGSLAASVLSVWDHGRDIAGAAGPVLGGKPAGMVPAAPSFPPGH